MTNLQSIHRIVRFAIGRKMLGSAVVLLVLAGQVIAQTSATDTRTPAGLTPGSPSGTYALSEFDNVNLYTGGLSFHVPLLKVGGRGGASYTMTLPIEQVWRVNHDYQFAQHWPNHNWWTGLRPGYGPGVLQGRQTHEGCGDGGPWPGGEVQTGSMTTLTFTAPDGTEYELRDELTGGNRLVSTCCCYYQQHANGASRGTVFKTFDGSAATFISDTTIYDWSGGIESGPHMIYPSGHLILRDGTRYRIESGQVIWIRDRNGNKLTFQGGITDSNGRTITVEQNVNDPTYGLCDRITFKGAGGATRRIWITKTTLANVLRNTRPYDLTTPQTYAALFDYLTGSSYTQHNPSGVISSVVLPDGRRYQFFYNTYSELARVVLPTGGAIEYDWDHGGGGNICGSGPEIQRHVTERRVYADGTTLQGKITYEGWDLVSRDANGTAIARSKHYFHAPTMACPSSISHNQWNEGKEYQTEEYTANGATLLKRINHTWQQTAPSWHSYWTFEAANNPKLITTQTTIEPNGANVVTKTTAINPQTGAIGFDQYNNQTDIWEYDFGVGAVGALLRHTHTDFLTVHPVSGSNYAADANIHLRGLPMQTSVYDANGIERARTTFEYDNYASDTNHAPLVYRPNISGFDSAFSTSYVNRGNVTATTNYLLTNGSVTGSISSFVQYDMAGNSVKAIDPRGYATSFDFTDRFGAPDGEARGNAGSAELNAAGQYSYAFPTLVTNALGHTAYVQFDYYIGQPVDGEDQNGVVSSGYFNDALDRPTQIIRAANQGASVKSQTTFSYDDANRVVTTTSDQNTFGDNLLKSQIVYDGLGRTTDTRQYESVSAHITVRQTYDALGRGYQTSNPFRAGESIVWTTTAYDPLSRIITVTTPDNAVVATSYWGNTVTVTDQAGKQRKSQTDGLGRLVHVYEDPNGLNYITSYAYDSLDNLTNVYQGSQTRTFVYDSLKRLASATNPESGTIGYQYDNNGNLTQKTDARGIVSTYAYDALNRNISVNYSDTTVNPDITRHYDNPINHGKGRYWHDYFYKDDGTIDHQAVDGYDALGRPWVRRQVFYSGGQWYHYETRNTYNLAGQVISQQYPSSHVTNYQYDNAGRLSSFIGNLGDGTQRTYANGLSYSSFGGLTQEQFGMQTTALYHKLHYNVRGQLYDVRVSTFSLAQNEFDWNRGCLAFYYGGAGWGQSSTANNGNISAQQHWAPLNEATTDYAYTQNSYSYDSLNRLSSVSELHGGPWGQSGTDYSQVYNYDRYGNRTINNGATWGAPNPQFGVDIATNRLTPPGGYSMNYDAAGNLTNDTYTGQGARTYDAENRMTQAWSNNQSQSYSYDADGHRARRKVNNIETWQVYGIGGELLAEYAPAASAATPQKEYGYRNGELLITAAAGSGSSGSGLRAQYFDTMNFTDLKVTRTDPAVDFDWGGGSPDPSVGVDTFTARWSGKVEPQYSQAYTFYTWTDDGVRLWVNGQLLIDKWIDQGPTEWSGQINLSGGQRYDIVMEYYENGGGATAKLSWSSASQAKQIIPAARLFPSSVGLSAQYFDTMSFADLKVTRTDATVDFDWGGGSPDPSVGVDTFTARWSGKVEPQYSQAYTFYTWTDDGVRLWVNGQLLIDKWIDQGPTEWSGQITLSAGQRYDLVMEYYENGGGATAKLSWSSASQAKQIVPAARLFPLVADGASSIQWLVTDHLGTPRMIFDQTGSLANVSRHDYLPFGEELYAGTGGRTVGQGYTSSDNVRQKFTRKERDNETGLDYFLARYYSSAQGRFTSADPSNPGRFPSDPQSWNGYAYARNNPLKYQDPDGREFKICDLEGRCAYVSDDLAKEYTFNKEYQKKSGYYTRGDGKIYGADGSVIGTYENLGCDCWTTSQQRMVSGIAEELGKPTTYLFGAAAAIARQRIFPRPIKPVNLPAPRHITIDMVHIAEGHMHGGARAVQSAAAGKGKNLFPQGMSIEQVQTAILDAYGHSTVTRVQGTRVVLDGVTKDGTIIQMWFDRATDVIETAYPVGRKKQ